MQVRDKKGQTQGGGEAPLVPFLSQSEVAQKASLYTAVEGEFEGQGAESPSCTNLQHALENKAHEGSERQAVVSCVNYQNVLHGGGGNRTQPCKSLQNKDLGIMLESGVIKSVIIADSPEDEQLTDVISVWASLPPNIRTAIVLLVQQHVQ